MNESKLSLFVLEDDKKQLKVYRDAIEAFSKEKKVKISPEFSDSLDSGSEKLKSRDFDAAIIDLKLGSDDTEGKGNKIIREIKQNLRFPIFVMTGFMDELDSDLREPNVFYKTYKRTEKDTTELLEEITNLYNTGITKILGRRGEIETALQKVFWKHFACNMDDWKPKIQKPEECEKILLRHILACLSTYLEIDETGKFVYYTPAEAYIVPPIRKDVFTGDILKDKSNGELFIVLTPPCDIAQGKAKYVVLAHIESKNMEYVKQQKRILSKSVSGDEKKAIKKEQEEAKQILKELLTNTHSLKYHFLPWTNQFSGGFVDFQKIESVKLRDVNNYEIVASTTEKFVKDIIARFSHYYARQGQPDFDVEVLMKEYEGQKDSSSV